jgi:hypothetical protein
MKGLHPEYGTEQMARQRDQEQGDCNINEQPRNRIGRDLAQCADKLFHGLPQAPVNRRVTIIVNCVKFRLLILSGSPRFDSLRLAFFRPWLAPVNRLLSIG